MAIVTNKYPFTQNLSNYLYFMLHLPQLFSQIVLSALNYYFQFYLFSFLKFLLYFLINVINFNLASKQEFDSFSLSIFKNLQSSLFMICDFIFFILIQECHYDSRNHKSHRKANLVRLKIISHLDLLFFIIIFFIFLLM